MPRGPGGAQRPILSALAAASGPLSRNTLMWSLAEAGGAITGAGIRASWYSSFCRAVGDLRTGPRVRGAARRLENLDEVCETFPFMTRSVPTRDLRRSLLPLLKEIAYAEFDDADNELHEMARLRGAQPERAADLGRAWRLAERRLLQCSDSFPEASTLVAVLARGRQLFLGPNAGVSASTSLRSLVLAARKSGVEQGPLADVEALRRLALPESTMRCLGLKSEIESVARFGRNVAKPGLKEEAKRELLRLAPHVVRGLPGHREPARGDSGPWGLDSLSPTEFSPLLDTLLDRHVLGRFEFLELI